MNPWTALSIEYAAQRNYLDDLFKVYPTIPEGIREINAGSWQTIEQAHLAQDNEAFLKALLSLKLFPIKDSYVAFLKRDKTAIRRNPETVGRLCGRLYEMGLTEIYRRSSEPKETNRQIGPMFRDWLKRKTLGLELLRYADFESSTQNAILDGSDAELKIFAAKYLNYEGTKGLDFVARIRG